MRRKTSRKPQSKRKKDTAYHPEDCANFRTISEELVNSIYGNAPEAIKEIYKKILWSLLMKMNVPTAEAREIMGEIGGRGMGYLFENMEKMVRIWKNFMWTKDLSEYTVSILMWG